MKKVVLILCLFSISSFTLKYSDYCDGYKIGYKKGYCYGQYSCLPPVPPLCPVKRLGEKDSFEAGYDRGFLDGNHDAR